MGKRLLISLLLIAVMIAAVTAGATLLFRNHYSELNAMQAAAADAETSELPTLSSQVEPARSQSQEEEAVPAPERADSPVSNMGSQQAKALVGEMTLEEKICQMLFVSPEALINHDYSRVIQSGETTRQAIEQYPVGGVIYFGNNLVSVDQTTEMIENIQAYARERTGGLGLFIGVDEEGGTVARLADNLGTADYEDMAVYGEEGDPQKAYEIGITIASDMRGLGFNVDFAPVADVLTNEDNTVVKRRAFGSDPALVAEMVSQEVKGFVSGGVLCAPKHFPGHGSTGGDTHNGYASSDRTLEELRACDFLPFQAAIEAGAPMIMVGHMTMTEIDEYNPASLSKDVVTGLLREELGYDGIIITDALDMSAITDEYTSGEAAVQAIQAGCDMLLCVYNVQGAVDAITEAVNIGLISRERIDESVTRIVEAKLEYGIY